MLPDVPSVTRSAARILHLALPSRASWCCMPPLGAGGRDIHGCTRRWAVRYEVSAVRLLTSFLTFPRELVLHAFTRRWRAGYTRVRAKVGGCYEASAVRLLTSSHPFRASRCRTPRSRV